MPSQYVAPWNLGTSVSQTESTSDEEAKRLYYEYEKTGAIPNLSNSSMQAKTKFLRKMQEGSVSSPEKLADITPSEPEPIKEEPKKEFVGPPAPTAQEEKPTLTTQKEPQKSIPAQQVAQIGERQGGIPLLETDAALARQVSETPQMVGPRIPLDSASFEGMAKKDLISLSRMADEAMQKGDWVKAQALIAKQNAIVGQSQQMSQAEGIAKQREALEEKQALDNEKQKDIEGKHKDYLTAVENVDKQLATASIDPYRKLRGTDAIAPMVGILLGGIASGLSSVTGRGQENQALKYLEQAINRDVAMQEFEYNKLREKKIDLKNDFGKYLEATGDIQAAKSALYANRMKNAELLIQEKLAQNQGLMQNVNAQKMAADVGERRVLAAQDMNMKMRELAIRKYEVDMKNANDMASFQRQALLKQSQEYKDAYIPGVPMLAQFDQNSPMPDKSQRDEMTKMVGSYKSAIGILDEVISWREKYGTESMPGQEYARMRQKMRDYINERKKMENFGAALSDQEKALIAAFEDPGKYGYALSEMKAAKEEMTRSAREKLLLNRYVLPSANTKWEK